MHASGCNRRRGFPATYAPLPTPAPVCGVTSGVLCFIVSPKSALLALQGVRHNLGSRETLGLWADGRFALPAWLTSRYLARYVHACLFDSPDTALASKALTPPPGLLEGLRVRWLSSILCVPQRADWMTGVCHEALEAAQVMEGPTLRSLPTGAGSKPPPSGIG